MAQDDRSGGGVHGPRPDTGPLRSLLHRAVPSHFQDPFGLALRILRSRNRDALSAVLQAGLKLGLSPADLLLAALHGEEGKGLTPARPILFVTGPPRSGTTLLHQLLIRSLPVAYVTNLASLLPKSAAAGAFPLTASIANAKVHLESYYGRTRALSGPSDGLEFWDRWLGSDRRSIPDSLAPGAAADMRRFFSVFERRAGRPVVGKNNNLLGCAALVGAALPTARFVCLSRDPLYLAQSLLKARTDIHGDDGVGYGIADPSAEASADPIDDVWRQVAFYTGLARNQLARLGPDRFRIVSYETLCEDPAAVVRSIAAEVFGFDAPVPDMAPLRPSARRKIEDETFRKLAARRPDGTG